MPYLEPFYSHFIINFKKLSSLYSLKLSEKLKLIFDFGQMLFILNFNQTAIFISCLF